MESFDTVYKEFRSLVYMMKKRIVYKGYTFKDGRKTSYPLSRRAMEIIEENGSRIDL